MSDQSLFEKLQLKDEKNLLIHGIPSTIEKQFIKLSFAKCITPLLKIKKIDFVLVFAVSRKQLCDAMLEIIPVLQPEAKIWIAYPKLASKIASDLHRHCDWNVIGQISFDTIDRIDIDNTWTAVQFRKKESQPAKKPAITRPVIDHNLDFKTNNVAVPEELKTLFKKNRVAETFFDSLSVTNRMEYVEYAVAAKKSGTRTKRLDDIVEKLAMGKKTPTAR